MACAQLLGRAPEAAAQGEDDLAAVRKLFSEALKDEQDKHFDAALEKFRQVQRVRDTVNVRFRIATCLEGLGRRAAALQAYESTILLGRGDSTSTDTVRAANDRATQLDKTVARLTIVLSAHAPADAEVTVDGTPVARDAMGAPFPLDPGNHTVRGHAKDVPDFQTAVTLPEGGHASITVPLDPIPANPPPPIKPVGPPGGTPDEGGSSSSTAGFVTLAGGALLLAGAGVTLVLRHGDISTLNSSCPGGVCPAGTNESELESTRKRALFEGPLALGLGVAGLAVAGVGVYLIVHHPKAPLRQQGAPAAGSLAIGPVASRGGGELTLRGSF